MPGEAGRPDIGSRVGGNDLRPVEVFKERFKRRQLPRCRPGTQTPLTEMSQEMADSLPIDSLGMLETFHVIPVHEAGEILQVPLVSLDGQR
ncbi:hypothetical protein ES703_38972 [subsurface metagenome]